MDKESIAILNKQLVDQYGLFENGQANYRLVWADDQFEHRLGNYAKFDDHGNYLGESGETFQYVPKYRQWMPHQWVLEMLLPVPDLQKRELTNKLSYEPIWGFHDKNGKPLDPRWDAIHLIIESLRTQAAKSVKVKYKDPLIEESDPKIGFEVKEARIKKLTEELFGNETDTGDALSYKEGEVVPSNYKKQQSILGDDNGSRSTVLDTSTSNKSDASKSV